MKKIIITYGVVAGLIVALMLAYSAYFCYSDPDFKPNAIFGFGTMLVAFAFIFFGIKNFRDKHNHGFISFGKAFKIGFFIALIASTFYVLTWLIEYYTFYPDFMDKYAASTLKQAHENGSTASEIAATTIQINNYKEWYKNPMLVILLTYMEIFPMGLVVSAISALILKKKNTTALKKTPALQSEFEF